MLVSRNYPPSAALAPFITRHYVFSGELPDDFELIDLLVPDSAFVRVFQRGDWATEIRPGTWRDTPGSTFFGSASRFIRIRVRGPFYLLGIGFRPCGWRALFERPASEYADRMLPFAEAWGEGANRLQENIAELEDYREMIRAVEDEVVRQLNRLGTWQVDEAMRDFERITRTDSTRQVKDVAAQLGLSPRQFERHSLTSFGHSPKLVLRRSRFLDMAAALRGFGDASEEQLAELRYFDQSHRNREFREFIGMTPQQFANTPTPFFTPALRARLSRRAELSSN